MSQTYIGKGLIIYCDGGTFKGNPAPYGAGLHWYEFSNEEPNFKHFPIKELNPGSKGYVSKKLVTLNAFPEITSPEGFVKHVLEDETEYQVSIGKMYDYARGFDQIGTNNTGELQAMLKAFQVIAETYPDAAIIYSDSEYVIKGLNYLPNWKKNNFITTSGRPVANKEIWLELDDLKQKLVANKIPFKITWIKGHGDETKDNRTNATISNLFADKMARIGASLSNNLGYGLDLTDSNGEVQVELTLDDLKEEKDPEKIHPLLVNKRVYLPYGGRTDKHTFFIGNPGHQIEDEFIGKQIPDAQIGIVCLKERNPIIEMVEDVQNKWLEQHYGYNNLMYCLQLSNISNTKTYYNLSKYREAFIARPKGVPNLETINGEGLTYVNDPVYLAMKNIDRLVELGLVLHSYRTDDGSIKAFDLTEMLYDTVELEAQETIQGKSEKLIVGKTLKKEFGTGMKSLRVPLELGGDGLVNEVYKKDIILTSAVDIPRRNQLKKFEVEFPSVKLLTWHASGYLYGFALLIALHEKDENGKLVLSNYGIWRGAVCSQILLQ